MTACANPKCPNTIESRATGRPRLFCSVRCRKQVSRCHETPPPKDTGEGPKSIVVHVSGPEALDGHPD